MAKGNEDEAQEKTSLTGGGESAGSAEKQSVIDRRSYIKAAGTAAAASVVGVGTASAATDRHGISFDRVVDAVDDLGCDPDGDDACQGTIRNAAADGTLIVFPAGTYRISGNLSITGHTNFGIYGEGDVTFEIPGGTQIWAPYFGDMTNALFEGVTIDQTARNAIGRTKFGCTGGKVHVEDVHIKGVTEPISGESKFRILPYSRDPDGLVVVKNFVAPDGGAPGTYINGGGGTYVAGANNGTVRFIDCHFEGFPNNGAYCSRTAGNVQFIGGLYKNNDVSQLRFSGEGSYAEGVTCVVDHNDWGSDKLGSPSDAKPTRCIWWEGKDLDKTGGEIRNCTLIAERWDPGMNGALAVNGNAGAMTVRDTHIQCNVNTQAVRADSVTTGSRRPPAPHWVRAQNLVVTGDAGGRTAALVQGRDDSRFENCCFHQTGSNRDGVKLSGVSNATIADTNVNVDGRAIVLNSSSADTTNVTEDGDCSGKLPTTDSYDHTVTVEGGSPDDEVYYELSVGGELRKSTAMDASINSGDSVSYADGTAAGLVGGGRDSYEFTGDVTDFYADGDVTVYVDGEQVGRATLPGPTLDHTVTIEGAGAGESVAYDLSVGGDLRKSTAMGASVDGNDAVSGSTAAGFVGGGRDSYAFGGEVTGFAADGDVTLYLDGQEVTESQLTNELSRHVEISSTGSDRAHYEFTATGDVAYGDRANPDADYPDRIEGSSASGSVAQYGTDDYRFSGELESVVVDGPADVFVDGEQVTPDEPAEATSHTIEISSTGSDRAFYEFSATDGVEYGDGANPDADYPDQIDGTDASGSVALYGTDDYTFTGELESVVVDGPADVFVDGEQVEPRRLTWHELEISSTGEDRAFYEFAVSGDLEYGDRANPDADYPDSVDGSSASGSVALYGTDSYRFSGDLESVSVDGPAQVLVDGQEVR